MPKAAPINADLIRAIFTYDPETGALIPKPTAPLVVRRTDANQWEVGRHRYSLHRLVWAYHHPENPNPQYVAFKEGWRNDPRIENLEAKDVHPRWEGHIKQTRARLSADGCIILAGDKSARANATTTPNLKPTPMSEVTNPQGLLRHTPIPKVRPIVDTSFVDEFEQSDFGARLNDTFDANDYDYQ
jgi:hypothetical protein